MGPNTEGVNQPTVTFRCLRDASLIVALPERSRVLVSKMILEGQTFTGDLLAPGAGADVQPAANNGTVTSDSLILDFHAPRTFTRISLTAVHPVTSSQPGGVTTTASEEAGNGDASKKDENDKFVKRLACVLRVWGGGQWYLPAYRNLFRFEVVGGNPQNGQTVIAADLSFPKIRTDKVLLSFVTLLKQDGTDIDLSDDKYAYVDDLNEILLLNENEVTSLEKPQKLAIQAHSLKADALETLSGIVIGTPGRPPQWTHALEWPEEQQLEVPDTASDLEASRASYPAVTVAQGYASETPYAIHERKNERQPRFHLIPINIHSESGGVLHWTFWDWTLHDFWPFFRQRSGTPFAQDTLLLEFQEDEVRRQVPAQRFEVDVPEGQRLHRLELSGLAQLQAPRLVPLERYNAPVDLAAGCGIQPLGGRLATRCVVTEETPVSAIELLFASAFAGMITLHLMADREGKPDDAQIIGSATFEVSEPATGWLLFRMKEPVPLQPGYPVWLVLDSGETEIEWQLARTRDSDLTLAGRGDTWSVVGSHISSHVHAVYRLYEPVPAGEPVLRVKFPASGEADEEIWSGSPSGPDAPLQISRELDGLTSEGPLHILVECQVRGKLNVQSVNVTTSDPQEHRPLLLLTDHCSETP